MGLRTYYIHDKEFDPMYRHPITQQQIDDAERSFQKAIKDLKDSLEQEKVNGQQAQRKQRLKAAMGPRQARWR